MNKSKRKKRHDLIVLKERWNVEQKPKPKIIAMHCDYPDPPIVLIRKSGRVTMDRFQWLNSFQYDRPASRPMLIAA